MRLSIKHYAIPRGGQVVAVVVQDCTALRLLRTELELLRRIGVQVQKYCVRSQFEITPFVFDDVAKEELRQILFDAQHPLVSEVIAHIDRDFWKTREEILMTIVQEEAEDIATAALECGVMTEQGEPSAQEEAVSLEENKVEELKTIDSETPIEVALEQAAEGLAELTDVITDNASPVETTMGEPSEDSTDTCVDEAADTSVGDPADADTGDISQDFESPVESADMATESEANEPVQCDNEEAAEDNVDDAIDALEQLGATDDQSHTADITDDGDAIDSQPASDSADTEAVSDIEGDDIGADDDIVSPTTQNGEAIADSADIADDVANSEQESAVEESQASDLSAEAEPSDSTEATDPEGDTPPETQASDEMNTSEYTPERAERAVEEIEQGIRKLANLLSTQVNDQWSRAGEAFSEIMQQRDDLETTCSKLQTISTDLEQIKEDASKARDETVTARDEARQFREDAKRAKERADKSAEAAERSADEASDEAKNAKNLTTTS